MRELGRNVREMPPRGHYLAHEVGQLAGVSEGDSAVMEPLEDPGVRRIVSNRLAAHKRWDEAMAVSDRHLDEFVGSVPVETMAHWFVAGHFGVEAFERLVEMRLRLAA